jgi:hypothetical protein
MQEILQGKNKLWYDSIHEESKKNAYISSCLRNYNWKDSNLKPVLDLWLFR